MKRHRVLLAVLACSSLIIGATPRAQDGTAGLIARIEAAQTPNRQGWDPYTMQELMERFSVPGASIAVIKDYQLHATKVYGLADVTAKSPVTLETMFQAASISKPVTAFAVMRLVEAGKLSLDEDVNRYLKSWKVPENEFTRERSRDTAGALEPHVRVPAMASAFLATLRRPSGQRWCRF